MSLVQLKFKGKLVFLGICRNCEHWHHNGDSCASFFTVVRDLNCSCTTWEPEDNLEYLEYKSKEKV